MADQDKQSITEVQRFINFDTQLNKTVFDLATYSALGYFVGFGVSLLFKRKTLIRSVGAGLGAGYQFNDNQDLFNLKRHDKQEIQ